MRNRLFALALLCMTSLAPHAGHARVEMDADQLRAWAKETFSKALADGRISGAVMAVVQDGEVKLLEGFGYADFIARTPMDPSHTRVQIGSISKTFTATAIAQLLDRGIIASLDDPANKYLKRMQLPPSHGKEITLWNLLTHRAGMDDRTFGLGTDREVPYPITAQMLADLRPAYVFPPDTTSSYSNYGIDILGVLIEDRTGQTLGEYFHDQLFAPLKMPSSLLSPGVTFKSGIAQPYAFHADGSAQKLDLLPIHPFVGAAGGIESSALDMAQYMNAHLGYAPAEARFLSEPIRTLMKTRHTGNHPAVSGFGMTFFLTEWNGERIADHGGGWVGFPNVMILLPDSNAGVFFGILAGPLRLGLFESLAEKLDGFRAGRDTPVPMDLFEIRNRFLTQALGPYTVPKSALWAPIDVRTTRLDDYVGTYWGNRRAHLTMATFLDLLWPSLVRVERGADGLQIRGLGPFVPVAKDVFALKRPAGDTYFAFSRSPDGKVRALNHYYSLEQLVRTSFWSDPHLLRNVLWFGMLLALTGVLSLLWRVEGRAARTAKLSLIAMSALTAAGFLLMTTKSFSGETWIVEYNLGHSWRFNTLVLVADAVAVTTLILLVSLVAGLRTRQWRGSRQRVLLGIHGAIVAAAGIGMLWVGAVGRLLGWNPP